MKNFNLNQIVRGINAGTFRVIGFENIGGEDMYRLKAVNPDNHAQEARGSLCLPAECLVALEENIFDGPVMHKTGLVALGC